MNKNNRDVDITNDDFDNEDEDDNNGLHAVISDVRKNQNTLQQRIKEAEKLLKDFQKQYDTTKRKIDKTNEAGITAANAFASIPIVGGIIDQAISKPIQHAVGGYTSHEELNAAKDSLPQIQAQIDAQKQLLDEYKKQQYTGATYNSPGFDKKSK